MKDSDVLKRAKQFIKTKREHRICYAISRAANSLRCPKRGDSLQDWVHKMLGTFVFYEDWVVGKHPKFAEQKGITRLAEQKGITRFRHREELRPGRLAWLDWMIEQCEKEEAKC